MNAMSHDAHLQRDNLVSFIPCISVGG